ncbi:MAG: LLM class flavin-dependent oxidoreductase [Actinomycetota bacterium]
MTAEVRAMQVGISALVQTPQDAAFVRDAERLGAASAWIPETWAQDALTPLAYLAGQTTRIKLGSSIVQLGARSPANLAMSAMSLQLLSGGRFLLGVGVSGPQVMEGWHGVRFGSPLAMTRETIGIVRTIAGGGRLQHDGRVYQLPLPGGPGRALRSPLEPAHVPIYVAALGPRNLELTGELADGWIGNTFIPEQAPVFLDRLGAGAARAGRDLSGLDLVIPVAVEFTDDPGAAARRHARGYAFTIGAMGAPGQNFYNDAFTRLGFGEDVEAVQELWRSGRRDEAAVRVPAELGHATNLLGTPDTVRSRLRLYRDAGITTLQAKLDGDYAARLDTLAQLVDLVREVTAEPATAGLA